MISRAEWEELLRPTSLFPQEKRQEAEPISRWTRAAPNNADTEDEKADVRDARPKRGERTP